MMAAAESARAAAALQCIPPDLPRAEWWRVAAAAKAAGVPFDTFNDWSATAGNYNAAGARDTWKSLSADGGIGPATLYGMARAHGWRDGDAAKPLPRPRGNAPAHATNPAPHAVREPKPTPGNSPSEVWARCEAATDAHAYVQRKGAAGVPALVAGLRVLPAGDALRIRGQAMAGALVVPAFGAGGELQSLQLIPAQGDKMNLPGARMAGASFTVGEPLAGTPLYLCEGIGQAWACWQATGRAAVVCFGWGNVRRIAEQLHQKNAARRLVVVPDVGKEADADKLAADVGAAVARMPEGEPQNFDANDYAQREGAEALAALLETATEPAPPLAVQFADELPAEFEPPDELIEGVFTTGAASILYGASNSGKTFLAVDMAAAVARGAEWLGHRTEPGLVLYLAAESPQSVRSRLQAYQLHHSVRVADFAIVASPVNLFDNEADAAAIVDTVRAVARQKGKPVRLVVGDTLARLCAGANENSGEDMGRVVQRIDAIREATGAHFLLIHHSGKVAANGARGWSGMRAAIDTEIEVTDGPQGRCAEITKQRDLATNGERLGFRLEPVTLGLTKWGNPATSCVVVAADAPTRQTKRVSEVAGAIVEFLNSKPAAARKRDVVAHFEGRYTSAAVYKEMRKLTTAGVVHEAAGMVALAAEVPKGAD